MGRGLVWPMPWSLVCEPFAEVTLQKCVHIRELGYQIYDQRYLIQESKAEVEKTMKQKQRDYHSEQQRHMCSGLHVCLELEVLIILCI